MPLSAPFRTPSLQLGEVQAPAAHTPLVQSVPVPHASPGSHGLQVGPPQSTSLSAPFRTPSLQLTA
jgi:hypothetical protein